MSTNARAGNAHPIVACTRRKTVAAGEAIFPDEPGGEEAYKVLTRTGTDSPSLTAGELYTGQRWNRAATCTGAELWVISTGLGFQHTSDSVVSYEATFSS